MFNRGAIEYLDILLESPKHDRRGDCIYKSQNQIKYRKSTVRSQEN